jgi:hypothetical protein
MEFAARFFARGNAVAAGGYVHRVNDTVIRQNIPLACISSSLPIVGGSSESHTNGYRFVHEGFFPDAVLSFGPAFTKAWHVQDRYEAGEESRIHTTHVMAGVERVAVGKRLSIEKATAYLRSVYRHREQTSIKPVHVEIDGLVLDDVRFTVTLDTATFERLDTDQKLRAEYAGNPAFVKEHGHRFQTGPKKPSRNDEIPEIAGYVVCSLVQRLSWEGTLPPGAKVDERSNVIVWPDFGRIVLGEMLISGDARRLTLVRLNLGSPLEADIAFVETESNGLGAP